MEIDAPGLSGELLYGAAIIAFSLLLFPLTQLKQHSDTNNQYKQYKQQANHMQVDNLNEQQQNQTAPVALGAIAHPVNPFSGLELVIDNSRDYIGGVAATNKNTKEVCGCC